MTDQSQSPSRPEKLQPRKRPKLRPMASFFPPDADLTPDQRRADTALLRRAANTALFFALCRQMNNGCFRAQRCRGEPHECVGRFRGLMPEDAWGWIEAMFEGQRDGRPFEDVVEDYPDEFEAMVEWREALAKVF